MGVKKKFPGFTAMEGEREEGGWEKDPLGRRAPGHLTVDLCLVSLPHRVCLAAAMSVK
jgi:hypothetical protein